MRRDDKDSGDSIQDSTNIFIADRPDEPEDAPITKVAVSLLNVLFNVGELLIPYS